MALKTLKKKLLPIIFSGILGASAFLPSGCYNRSSYAQSTKEGTEYVNEYVNQNSSDRPYYRSLGMEKHDTGVYGYKDVSSYGLSRDKTRYMEELSIKDIKREGNRIELEISDAINDYAGINDCGLEAVLVDLANKSFISPSKIVENRSEIELPSDYAERDLRVGVYCSHKDDKNTDFESDSFTEILASYPVNDIGVDVSQISRGIGSGEAPAIPPVKENGEKKKAPKYETGEPNVSNEYRLATGCGEVMSISNYPIEDFGKIVLDQPKTCELFLKEEGDSIVDFNIIPDEIKQNVLYSLHSGDKRLTLNFNKPGEYLVYVETEKYPDEKDALIFGVREPIQEPISGVAKEIPIETKEGDKELRFPISFDIEEPSEKPSLFDLLEKGNFGNDEINADISYRPLPILEWRELTPSSKYLTHTLKNGLHTKKVKRIKYNDPSKPTYGVLTNGIGKIFTSNMSNLRIIPHEGYTLDILEFNESNGKNSLPSNHYYLLLQRDGDVDLIDLEAYMRKTPKKLKGFLGLSLIDHDFADRKPKFGKAEDIKPSDYSGYLAEQFNLPQNDNMDVKVKIKGDNVYKDAERTEIKNVSLNKAKNLEKYKKQGGYVLEFKYDSLKKPVVADYGDLERLLMPAPYTISTKDGSLERVVSGDTPLNTFIYLDEEQKKRLLIEYLANPELEETKGLIAALIVSGALISANAQGVFGAPSAKTHIVSAPAETSGTISGGPMY